MEEANLSKNNSHKESNNKKIFKEMKSEKEKIKNNFESKDSTQESEVENVLSSADFSERPINFADLIEEDSGDKLLGKKVKRSESGLVLHEFLNKDKNKRNLLESVNKQTKQKENSSLFKSLFEKMMRLSYELNLTTDLAKTKEILEAISLCSANLKMMKEM